MDDLITINTSDGHSLTVKRLHLLANSSVSADMMATLEQGNSVDFVETEKQRKPFLAALGGDLVGFEELDEEGLEDFAKLVDKYGFTFGEKMVRERLWRFVAEQDSFLHLFVEQLVHRLLPGTFSSLIEGRAASRVSPAWRDRIDAWRSLLQHHAART